MTRHALCIGINDYPGISSDLEGCVNDARDWAQAFRDRGCRPTVLLDRQATGKAIRDAIRSTLAGSQKGDLVVIQYSGHGSFVPDADGDEADQRDECLCPYDVARNGPITDDELHRLYAGAPRGVKVLVLSDSCHSGSVARFAPPQTEPRFAARVRFLPPAVFLGRQKEPKAAPRAPAPLRRAALLIAGCQDHEYSYDGWFDGRPNGAFSFAALRALQELPADATCSQWFRRIRKALPSIQYPQTPNLEGSSTMKRWRPWA